MAGDWIKMRTDLYRDPKVSVMADLLLDADGDLAKFVDQHCQRQMTVTRNVMRNVTVGALVSVWGVMRLRGKRESDDLVCKGATSSVLDDIADLPGFGAAMEFVGWAVETDAGLVLPRFFEDQNVDPEDAAKKKNADRQARFREKNKDKSNVTDDVTVTHREEKRREEETTHIPSMPAQISIVLRKYAINSNPSHPSVIALAEQGVDLETLEACCKETREAKPNETISIGYVLKKLEGWKAQAANVKLAGVAPAKPKYDNWDRSPAGIERKASDLGIYPRAGETHATLAERCRAVIQQQEHAA